MPRTTCSCEVCTRNCRFMPGFLIPADLERMIPPNVDEFCWAENNLLASPGAVAMKDGEVFSIPTLVPAVKEDGSCIHLSALGLCQIHESSPFGCAFFDCGPDRRTQLSDQALVQIYNVFYVTKGGLYYFLWIHLAYLGLMQENPETLRERMREEIS
jgi:hypothetical protein